MKKESGQALVSGIVFIMIVLFFCIYFVHYTESIKRVYTNTQIAKDDLIQKSSEKSNIINEISINNRIILSQIISAQRAFIESTQMGLYMSYTQPYWDTYSQSFSFSDNSKEKHLLSSKSRQNIEESYHALSLTTARNYFIAASASARNRGLIKKLESHIQSYFIEVDHAQIHCAAFEYLKKENLLKDKIIIPVVSRLYQFNFNAEKCTLLHKVGGVYQLVNKALPFLSKHDKSEVISFEDIAHTKYFSQYPLGLFIVPEKLRFSFLKSLKMKTQSTVQNKNHDSIFTKFLIKIKFLNSSIPTEKDYGHVLHTYESRIIHPFTEEPTHIFEESFFSPQWASVIIIKDDL